MRDLESPYKPASCKRQVPASEFPRKKQVFALQDLIDVKVRLEQADGRRMIKKQRPLGRNSCHDFSCNLIFLPQSLLPTYIVPD